MTADLYLQIAAFGHAEWPLSMLSTTVPLGKPKRGRALSEFSKTVANSRRQPMIKFDTPIDF